MTRPVSETNPDSLEDGSIDAGLHLLLLVTPRGVTRTQEEIAEACGCTSKYISYLERQAMKKLRRAFQARMLRGEI